MLLTFALLLWADTATFTWDDTDWNTTWTNGGGCTCDTSCVLEYQTTGGNPDHRRRNRCEGKQDLPTGHHEWTGTWENLGVTPGNTVSTVQMTDVDYQYTTDSNCDDVDIGPFELRDSANTLVATMWAGTGSLTTAGAYAAAGSQSAVSVGALSASNASIELWFQMIMDTANITGAICESSFDNLDISIVHSTPATNKLNRMIISQLFLPGTYETVVHMGRHKITSETRRIIWPY